MAFVWPWPKGSVTSQEFGTRPGGVNPSGGHTGMDVPLPVGTPLRAPGDGMVVFAGWAKLSNNPWLLTEGGGIVLGIDFGHGQPLMFMAHLSRTDLNVGDAVAKGQVVAYSGNTGKWTTGPHVHFEVLLDGYWLQSNTYGRTNPRVLDWVYWEDLVAVNPQGGVVLGDQTRKVTTEGANVRTAPFSDAPKAAGYEDGLALGANLAVVGYVKAEAVTPGNDAWYKTKSGFFVWANAAGDDIAGLKYLGEVTRPAPPAPPAPPVVDPAPVPKYDFELDFTVLNGITVEKIPAHWDNYGEDFPEKPEKAVCHWWNSLENRPSLESVIGEFCHRSTSKSPHFIVSDLRIIQTVSLKDRAFHAGPGGNDWVGIEIDPRAIEKNADGSYTARALRIQANVRSLLEALNGKFGYKLSLTLHKDVPGAATACSDLVLSDFVAPDAPAPEPEPTPEPEPEPLPEPEPVPDPEPEPTPAPVPPAIDEAGVLRRFFEWLIQQFLTRKEK